jgi:hypothetical protein
MKGRAAERFASGLHQKTDQSTRKISFAWISQAAAKRGSKKLHATPQILRISAKPVMEMCASLLLALLRPAGAMRFVRIL